MSKATSSSLGELHRIIAEHLADRIQNGETQLDQKTGELVRLPASAAVLSAAIKFLKDNDIVSDVETNAAVATLKDTLKEAGALPFPGEVERRLTSSH